MKRVEKDLDPYLSSGRVMNMSNLAIATVVQGRVWDSFNEGEYDTERQAIMGAAFSACHNVDYFGSRVEGIAAIRFLGGKTQTIAFFPMGFHGPFQKYTDV